MISFKNLKLFLFISFVLWFFSCNSDDDSFQNGNEQTSQMITTTNEKLVGDWKLVSSTIGGKSVSSSEFECLKHSIATFYQDNTYELTCLKLGRDTVNPCSQTSIQSGTYTVISFDNITFFNSTSEIKLINDTLQITYKNTNGNKVEDQIHIFIRSDNMELEETLEEETGDLETEESETGDNNEENNNFDGTEVIKSIIGKWKIDSNQDCFQKNIMEFKPKSVFEFIQHKTTFNRRDLLDYNISMSYPLQSNFKATVNKGNDVVVFDTSAECQFTKISILEYIVKNEKTILLKNISGFELILEDMTTMRLIYTFTGSNNNEQQIKEFVYKKL